MNDQPAPFSPFSPSPPPADPAAQGKPTKKRGRKAGGGKKEVKLSAVKEAPVPTRKRARNPQALKIDPMVVFEAAVGLSLDDVPKIAKLIGEIQKFPKKSRAKIVAALGKVFA